MFTINIYLRLSLIIILSIIGVILANLFGFWYAFPLFLVALLLLVGYLLTGTVQSAGMMLQSQDFEAAKKRLKLTIFPGLLVGPARSGYYMLKGAISMQDKDYAAANDFFKTGENSKFITDNEKAVMYLQQANIAVMKGNMREAQIMFDKTKGLKVTESMIKDQIKQFDQALRQKGQLTVQNKLLAQKRGGSKQRRPKMR